MHWIYAHLIGDFLLQPDILALNKKKSNWYCFIHVCIYMIPFLFCNLNGFQFILIAIQHYIGDRFELVRLWTKLIGSERFLEPPMWPWPYIIIDQIFHILWMASIVHYL